MKPSPLPSTVIKLKISTTCSRDEPLRSSIDEVTDTEDADEPMTKK